MQKAGLVNCANIPSCRLTVHGTSSSMKHMLNDCLVGDTINSQAGVVRAHQTQQHLRRLPAHNANAKT